MTLKWLHRINGGFNPDDLSRYKSLMAKTGVFRLCLNSVQQLRCFCPMQKVSIHSSVNILPSAVNIPPHVPLRSSIGSQLHHQKNNFNDFLKTSSGGLLHEYRLPGVGLKKTVIVDPIFSGITEYKDPTFNGVVLDKTVPSSGYASIISDPSPLQRVIDEGAPPISKETRPHMIRIRHWKMKKHKRKKFKKRMLFVLRKKRMLKKKKKEKVMLEFEAAEVKKGKEFDAEKLVDEELARARDAGWGIDIIAENVKRKQST